MNLFKKLVLISSLMILIPVISLAIESDDILRFRPCLFEENHEYSCHKPYDELYVNELVFKNHNKAKNETERYDMNAYALSDGRVIRLGNKEIFHIEPSKFNFKQWQDRERINQNKMKVIFYLKKIQKIGTSKQELLDAFNSLKK